jgi:thymidylate synthase
MDYQILNTEDIKQILIDKYKRGEFRVLYPNTDHEVKTIEIQHAHFLADKDSIIRSPNYDYAKREIEWYDSQSLNVNDIPGDTPKIWQQCADKNGIINSNYGWVLYSPQNFMQYANCVNTLINDPHSRQAIMIYNRPSMQYENKMNGMHDFMCTFSTQVFLNDNDEGEYILDYIVNMRSNDAVFGYCNDYLFHKEIQNRLVEELSNKLNKSVIAGDIIWNAGSLHVYERHFKFLNK